jgi:hypothetical protein
VPDDLAIVVGDVACDLLGQGDPNQRGSHFGVTLAELYVGRWQGGANSAKLPPESPATTRHRY